MNIILTQEQLEALCEVLGDTHSGFTTSELYHLLDKCTVKYIRNESGPFYVSQKKSRWLFNTIAEVINSTKSNQVIFKLIEVAMSPASNISKEKRERYEWLFQELNKVLLLQGLSISREGKLIIVEKANTVDEVDARISGLNCELYRRHVPDSIRQFCNKELLVKDYSGAIFEATKGLAERVRQITGLTTDGGDLFQKAFSVKNPQLGFNMFSNESEISEFKGLGKLLEALFNLVRNPIAHTPKINWIINENDAFDIFTIISFASKYLDCCFPIKGYSQSENS